MESAIEQREQATGRVPSFIHIGGQRCGTTWVHKCLEEHPEIFTADPKELHFFDNQYDKGEAWYLSRFTPGPEHKAWGELTPAYMSRPNAAELIHAMCPEAKLVACLRHPVERAYSAYNLKRHGDLKYETFEDALEAEPDMWERGLYAQQLERFFEYFPREQVLVQLYDDLVHRERKFIRDIYTHIGVDPEFTPSWLGKTHNAVIMPQMQDRLKGLGLGWTIEVMRDSPLGPMVRRWNHKQKSKKAGSYKGMKPETRKKLHEYYRGPNRELEKLLGVDVSAWDD